MSQGRQEGNRSAACARRSWCALLPWRVSGHSLYLVPVLWCHGLCSAPIPLTDALAPCSPCQQGYPDQLQSVPVIEIVHLHRTHSPSLLDLVRKGVSSRHQITNLGFSHPAWSSPLATVQLWISIGHCSSEVSYGRSGGSCCCCLQGTCLETPALQRRRGDSARKKVWQGLSTAIYPPFPCFTNLSTLFLFVLKILQMLVWIYVLFPVSD